MTLLYPICWIISFIAWLYFLIKTIKNLAKKEYKNVYIIEMWIANIFMWIFAILKRIAK